MTNRAWDELIDLIDEKYQIDNSNRKTEPLEDNKDLTRTVESIEFEKDNVKYKIERIAGPVIIDKKTFYHQTGSANRVQYVYDPEETSTKVVFYRGQPDGYWNEIQAEDLLS
ncbi:hypothetical protein HYX70_01015 [Candidatus Saccharibacteria bacterium]|nr:hypothetical protein [Candidatus Saccharibacteria bacterium]